MGADSDVIACRRVREKWPTQKEYLKEPIEDDRELAEEERAENIRGDQNIVEHEQRNRKNAHRAKDIEEIGQRCKSPLALIELKQPIDARRVENKAGQKQQQRVEALLEPLGIKTQPETCNDRCGRHHDIVYDDQPLAGRQLEYWIHEIAANALSESLNGIAFPRYTNVIGYALRSFNQKVCYTS
jgi:hypothetical protein